MDERVTTRAPALSVRQPWAWAIMHAGKDVENRTWATAYRGDLLIHAGQRVETSAAAVVEAIGGYRVPERLPRGGLLVRVRLVEVHHAGDCYLTCSPWAQPGCWHWTVAYPQPFAELVPCPGRLGLFRPRVIGHRGGHAVGTDDGATASVPTGVTVGCGGRRDGRAGVAGGWLVIGRCGLARGARPRGVAV